MLNDLRHAIRALGAHKGFVVLAATVLGLAIGLNTALFSIVYAMLYRPFPVGDSGELVSLYMVLPRQPGRPHQMTSDRSEHFAQHAGIFTGVTDHVGTSYAMRADDRTDMVRAEWVRANYFDVLAVTPALGRTFVPDEDQPATLERAAVISHQLWTRRFDRDPEIVGRQVRLALYARPELVYTIVGVMPDGFRGISTPWEPTDVWVTYAQSGRDTRGRASALFGTFPIARLKPGVSLEQARAVVAAQGRQHYYSRPTADPQYEPSFVVLRTDDVRMPFDPSAAAIPGRLAGALTIVVGTVLLIAAANIGGILLARGAGRRNEIAVRRALGAGSVRLARQLLSESLLLAVLGGAAGGLLAIWLIAIFHALTPSEFALEATFEPGVVAFAVLVCLVCGVTVGVAPAVQASRLNVLPFLTGGNTVIKGSRRRIRHAITIPQVACSLALLVVAATYVRTLVQIETADLGYQPENVIVATPMLRPEQGADAASDERVRAERDADRSRRFYRQLLGRLQAIPGIAGVSISSTLPLRDAGPEPAYLIVSYDRFLTGDRHGTAGDRASVSPGYFRTVGIPLVNGRDFDERDTPTFRRTAIVSRDLAQRLWPDRDPIGQQLTVASSWDGLKDQTDWFEVVGVAGDVSPVLAEGRTRPTVYLPLGQEWRPDAAYVVARAHGDSRALIPFIKAAVAGSDPFADLTRAETMRQRIAGLLYPRRIAGAVLASAGLVALLLAIVGIYGVVAYSVAQRTSEIGVRMALGASGADIVRLVMRDGARIALVGTAGGLLLGYVGSRMTATRFLALPPFDGTTVAVTTVLLSGVILLACLVPARRAARVDAMEVLRRS